jgi:cell division protein YceG involved in septum cleavage
MFFVAKDDDSGEHAFAVTKEEQDANVERYLNSDDG